MLILGRGEVHKDAVVGLHAVDEHTGEPVAPELAHWLVASGLKPHAVLHAIGHDRVHGTQQPVEKTGDPQVLLPVDQCLVAERGSPQVLVGLSVVGHDGRHRAGKVKVGVAQLVFGRNPWAAIQLAGQLLHFELGHFTGQHTGHGLEARLRPGLGRHLLGGKHNLGIGQKYLHLDVAFLF